MSGKLNDALAVVSLILLFTYLIPYASQAQTIPAFPSDFSSLIGPFSSVAPAATPFTGVLGADLAAIGSNIAPIVVGPSAVGSLAGNLVCTPVIPTCPCGTVPSPKGCVGGPNMFMCGCKDLTFGFSTWGLCVAEKTCLTLGTIGITGLAIGVGKGIVGSILGGNSGNSGGASSYPMSLAGGSKTGCSGTPYITLTPSTDPCAVYIPTGATSTSRLNLDGSSSSPSVSSVLLTTVNNTSGTETSSSVSDTLLFTGTSGAGDTSKSSLGSQLMTNTTSGEASASSANTLSSAFFPNGFGQGVGSDNFSPFSNAGTALLNMITGNTNNTSPSSVSTLLGNYEAGTETRSNTANASNVPTKPSGVKSGTWGDIQINASGVTITAGGHDTDGRTGVAGFYGYNAVQGVTPTDLARQMCTARPWANSSATAIIPPSFYDSICTARGYNPSATTDNSASNSENAAGTSKIKNTGAIEQTSSAGKTTGTTSVKVQTTLPGPVLVTTPVSIFISAVPARIRLGARSTIYWSAKGVTSCVESSEDGSFNGNTLNGAASTVALYGNTEFTITCSTPDGSSASKSVVVETSS